MTPLVIWSHVWMVTGLGFLMVISLLVVLIFILKLLGAVISGAVKGSSKPSAPKTAPAATATAAKASSGADNDLAAIAMALHLYFNGVHDVEPTEIHIKRTERSGWASKLYGMNNLHR